METFLFPRWTVSPPQRKPLHYAHTQNDVCKNVYALDISTTPRYQQLTGLFLIPHHTFLPQTLLNRGILNWLGFVPSRHSHKDKNNKIFPPAPLTPCLVMRRRAEEGMECLAQHHSLILENKKTRAFKQSNYIPISGSKFPCQVVF